MSSGLVNTGWSVWVNEAAIFRPSLPTSCRLSGEMPRRTFYIGTGPNTATLSVAATNGGMEEERRKLIRSLCTEGISWQGRNERKGLAELLANERGSSPLVRIFENQPGGRERIGSGETTRQARSCFWA